MKTLPVALLVSLLVFACSLSAAKAQSAVPAAPSGVHADDADAHLLRGDVFYLEGDYYRAITEYKTFLLKTGEDARRSHVDLKIAWIYYLADKPGAAASILRTLFEDGQDAPEALWARLYLAHVAMQGDEPLRARQLYEQLLARCAEATEAELRRVCPEVETYARLGLARYYNGLHKFDEAADQLEQVPPQSLQSPDARKVAEYVRTLSLPSKSPALAGVLSVVPGLGHFYIEEWTIGIVAMVWNGLFIYATADSFAAGRYGQGTLLGLFELIWYAGTIFGAVSGAHRFNRDARIIVEEGLEKDLERLDDDLPWPARFPVAYPTPLQLRFEF